MIGVYDATGMLGRLVTARFDRVGAPTILIGPTQTALATLTSSARPRPTAVVASIDDVAALERALDGCSVLVNCAPGANSGERLVRAALDAGIHYVDAEGEQDHIRGIFEKYDEEATQCDVAIVPALGFGEAIGDCLAHLAAQSREPAASVVVAYAVDPEVSAIASWSAVTTTSGREFVYRDGSWLSVPLEFDRAWFDFPAPIGRQRMSRYGSGEVMTVPRHVKTQSVTTLITTTSLCPYPSLLPVFPVIRPVIGVIRRSPIRAMFRMLTAAITGVRSSTTPDAALAAPRIDNPYFVIVVEVHAVSGPIGRAVAKGGNVPETAAAILAQAALWLAGGSVVAGVHSAATAFEPHALLDSLAAEGLTWSVA